MSAATIIATEGDDKTNHSLSAHLSDLLLMIVLW